MSVSGTIWDKDKGDISDALCKHKGIVARAAKELNIARYTLYKKINDDPDLQKLLANLRSDTDEQFLDAAENIIFRSMADYEKRPANALRAAMYTISTRGKPRGWSRDVIGEIENISDSLKSVMNQLTKSQNQSLDVSKESSDDTKANSQYISESTS